MTVTTPAPDLPRIAVVVPTAGRVDLLDCCLDALHQQTLAPACMEVIVVDESPSHPTQQLVYQWSVRAGKRGLRITYLPNHGQRGVAAARNLGWRHARAPIIAFTDDDTVPAPSWLSNALAAFGPGIDALCGRVEMPVSARPTEFQREARRLETAEFAGANCFCRKAVLEALDGFDERFRFAWRDDSDLHFRLLEQGYCIARAPDVVVLHPMRTAPWGVSLLQLRHGSADALLYKKHPRLYRQKIHALPRWDYYAIVLALLVAVLGLVTGSNTLTVAGGGVWLAMTALFCVQRLHGTSRRLSHVAEMVVTSALIPPLAVFWRLVGAIRYRVRFA